jgi:toxin ParE1/3/4
LTDIWVHIAQDNPASADRVIFGLIAAEDRLAEFPELGRVRDDLRPGVRSWAVGAYLVLYRLEPDGVLIVRILHGARDLRDLLSES